MLTRLAVAVLALVGPSTGAAHADDFNWPGSHSVTAEALCQQRSALCTAHLTVADEGSEPTPSVKSIERPSSPRTNACHYEQSLSGDSSTAARSADSGAGLEVEHKVCTAGAENLGVPWAIMPEEQPTSTASLRGLVDQASKAMNIPAPHIALSPASDATQYVGLPLWAWTPASSWKAKAVSVSAGGVSLTMTATPSFSVWSMGDGGSMTCHGPGTPYPAGSKHPPRTSPDCGYTYGAPSTSQPDGSYRVSVTTHWTVTWRTTSGLSGAEPDMATTSSFPLTVSEIQALVTDVRP